MEKYVLGFFQEQLSKIIIGFRKEQVNTNLLNGKGEIKDVQLNCSILNKTLSQLLPFATFEEVHVTRLGFHVTSWANLRKAPIIVDIGCITAVVEEPLNCLSSSKLKLIRMMTEKELARLLEEGLLKPFRKTGSYGIVDRITDNITIEIEKFDLSFRPMGKFKTKRVGPWTPPTLRIECRNIRSVAVDLHGHEGNPDQIWAHNHRRNQAFLLCRKLSMETSIEIISCTHPQQKISLIKDTKMECQIAIRQRLRDGQILAIQSDMTIPSVDLTIEQEDLPLLASLLAGIQYCVSKDRSFEDPLKPASTEAASKQQESPSLSRSPFAAESTMSGMDDEDGGVTEDENEVNEAGASTNVLADSLSDSSSSSADDAENDAADAPQSRQKLETGSSQSDTLSKERPVLVLPLGITIHENLCITTSVHQVFVRGIYQGEKNGHVHMSARGSIAELIWPIPSEFGFYVQSSVSYCSIEEKYGDHVKTILINGMAREDHTSLENPSRKPREINVDENFPLFERRSIREDPLDMRHSFPSQGLGQKVTVDFLNSDMTNPKLVHEVGVDEVEVVLDAESWWRVARFALNDSGDGYDPRLHSGDWSDILSVEMLQNPTCALNLDEHLQDIKQLFLDENFMISSDLFNATLRFTNIDMRIPAAVKENIRACEVVVELNEATVTVTSALPRTFLIGKIGNSISDDMKEKGIIDFPNDPSDIAYALEREEDPMMRQQGMTISKSVSTFRQQVTVRGFQVRIIPVIPFCNAPDPQRLIAPTDSTLIACFEGEPPPPGSSRTKLVFFLSIQVHKLLMNVDFDLLAGMTSTLLFHGDTIHEILDYFSANLSPSATPNPDEPSRKIKKNLQGRRVMVRRHVSNSRETGGLAIVFCLQQSEFGITLWRQNLPLSSPMLSIKSDEADSLNESGHIMAMKLLDIWMGDFEIGFEFGFKDKKVSRTVLKCCLEKCVVKVCNFSSAVKGWETQNEVSSPQILPNVDGCMVDLLSFGVENLPGNLSSSPGQDQQFALRFEEQVKGSKAWSMAADLTSPAILNLCVDELKECLTLLIEALLMPTWSKRGVTALEEAPFPDKTIGAFFYSLVARNLINMSGLDNIDITAGGEFTDPLIERTVKRIFEALLPPSMRLLLFRLEVANLLVKIPIDQQSRKSVGVLLNQSDLCMRFCPNPSNESSDIEDVLACKGVAWSNLIKTKSNGFYQNFLSRSSLISITQQDTGVDVEFLIHPCGMEITYTEAKLDIAMSENLQISDIRLIEAVIKGIGQVGERCKGHLLDIISLIAAMKKTTSSTVLKIDDEEGKQSNSEAKHEEESIRLVTSRFLIKRLHTEMLGYEENIREILRVKDSELQHVKKQLFLKEKERFSALALLSSRVAGWIRMGGLHLTGQRVARKTTMWPYWAILRKDLLLLFSAPGEPRPLDVVLLVGAKIRELTGGSSIKRGFAIIESSGTTRFFVTATGPDYVFWTNELSTAIVACNGSLDLGDANVENELQRERTEGTRDYGNSELEDLGLGDGDTADSEGGSGLRERMRLGNRLAGAKNKLGSAIQTARQKGKEVSDRARTSSLDYDGSSKGSIGSADELEDLGLGDGDTVDSEGGSGLRERIRLGNRLAGAKNRVGSAIQTARQKGKEVSDRARTSTLDFDGSSKGSIGSADMFETIGTEDGRRDFVNNGGDDVSDGNSANAKRRFGSRIGSALQNARQRVRETPEKQGSLVGLRSKITALSPATTIPENIGEESDSTTYGRLSNSDNGSNEIKSVPADTVEGETSTWTCAACTFVNSIKNFPMQQATCDMCGSERKLGDDITSNGTSPDIASSSDTLSGSRHGTLSPVRESQDIPGSSQSNADSVRRGRFVGLGMGSPKPDVSMRQTGRFNFRRLTSDMSGKSSSGGDAVTMKNVYSSRRAPAFSPSEGTWEPLKSFEGLWAVRVSPKTSSPGAHSHVQEGDQKELESRDSGGEVSAASLPGGAALDSESTNSPSEPVRPMVKTDTANMNNVFRIQVRQVDKAHKESSSEKYCRLGDIFELYTQVSESIERVLSQLLRENPAPSRKDDLLSEDRVHLVDKVMVGGMMLGGLLDVEESSDILEKTHYYQAEVIEAFLNSLLGCPLPVETLSTLTEVLGICASTKNMITEMPSPDSDKTRVEDTAGPPTELGDKEELEKPDLKKEERPVEKTDGGDLASTKNDSNVYPAKLFGLLSTCEAELLRAENSVAVNSKAEKNVPKAPFPQLAPTPLFLYPKLDKPLLPASVQEQLNQSVHEALISVMAERDESNAQLVGSNVLHVHEVEREKRKNKMLEFELEVAKQGTQTNQPPSGFNLFAQKFDVGQKPDDKQQKDLEAKLKQLQRENNDDMMTALSRQLAIEINSKTEYEAEIKRMKESEKLKTDNKASENKALKEELKRVKELLAAEEQKKENAIKEAEHWKSSYESLKTG